jgi:UDP-N-acetylmuramate--alanine ligase
MIPVTRTQRSIQSSSVHFIGIGGIGMCGLAELLHNLGAKVSGSDQSANVQTDRLGAMGVKIHIGHLESNVEDVDVVVYSSAVPASNVEMKVARSRKIPTIPRAEVLAEIMRLKRGVAVGGTHGKTTTTSLTASIFLQAALDPTIVVGGRLDAIKSTALLGKGEWLIAEADESDGSFLKLSPELAIITNIDNDHLDHYGSFEELRRGFLDFAYKVPFYGAAVVCGDDPKTRELFKDFNKRLITYGFDRINDFQVRGEAGQYAILRKGQVLGDFKLPMPGKHNALNATAAVICALEAGISLENCQTGLANFGGVDRRFQHKGQVAKIDFYDDYGHHPTEVRATLQAFRERFPNRRVVVIFQPHRYSRTQLCWSDFATCFEDCDELFLCDIYPAGEVPIDGVTSKNLAATLKVGASAKISLCGKALESAKIIGPQLRSADVIVTLGAGDVSKLGPVLMEQLKTAGA